MKCQDCGQSNRDLATFCDSCGSRLFTTLEESTLSQDTPSTSVSFVGRKRELGELKTALDEALSGHGRLIMLVGEPGIGKTCTAQELVNIAESQGARVFWGRCYDGEGAPPYWPWVQPLRGYIRQGDPNQLRHELGAGAAEIAEVVSDIRQKLPDLESPPQLEPEQARFRLYDSITTFLRNIAQAQPLILVLEDLHWADRSSLLLLEFLVQSIQSAPILILGTYRDMEVARRHPLYQTLGSLIREQRFVRIQLHGLSQTEVFQLLHITTGTDPSSQLVELIHERTEGNPLFVHEISR